MIQYLKTGEIFSNRKEAKEKLGRTIYNEAVKSRQFTFHDSRQFIPFVDTPEFIDNILKNNK